ncbi:MAG: hypothetical protein ACTSPB_25320 [Candidatus Thorarchaeota archaeon]
MEEETPKLPDSMVERQLAKIQEHLFTNYTQDEESYQGTLKPEVRDIIFGNLKFNEALDEEAFLQILAKIIKELVDWVQETLDGINEQLLRRFMADFLHQFVQQNLSIAPTSAPVSPHDFSYM